MGNPNSLNRDRTHIPPHRKVDLQPLDHWKSLLIAFLVLFILSRGTAFFFLNLAALSLNCDMWDLVPRPGIKPGPPTLGAWSLATGPPEAPAGFFRSSGFSAHSAPWALGYLSPGCLCGLPVPGFLPVPMLTGRTIPHLSPLHWALDTPRGEAWIRTHTDAKPEQQWAWFLWRREVLLLTLSSPGQEHKEKGHFQAVFWRRYLTSFSPKL